MEPSYSLCQNWILQTVFISIYQLTYSRKRATSLSVQQPTSHRSAASSYQIRRTGITRPADFNLHPPALASALLVLLPLS